MRWSREEYVAHMLFEDVGKEMFTELFGPLVGLDDEWKSQGATDAERDLSAFGFDFVDVAHVGNCKPITDITPQVLEDNSEYRISIDEMGRKVKLIKSSATIPLPFSHPVETFDDWLKIKHWYEFDEKRIDKEALQRAKKLQEQGSLVVLEVLGGFDEPRQLLGEENLCIACYDEPELIKDILDTIGDTAVKIIERTSDIVTIDNLFIHEDMAGKSGPLMGPIQIDEFLAPYYKQCWDCASAYGTKLFSQDSDGNIMAVIDSFLKCGVNIFYPFEPAAGMDMVEARAKYGKAFAVKGGLDKLALREDKATIRKELEYKLGKSMLKGGTAFALDHRIPNGVSIENYRYYVELAREMLGLPAIKEIEKFHRMAF